MVVKSRYSFVLVARGSRTVSPTTVSSLSVVGLASHEVSPTARPASGQGEYVSGCSGAGRLRANRSTNGSVGLVLEAAAAAAAWRARRA